MTQPVTSPQVGEVRPGTMCTHLLLDGGREVASYWLPVEASIEQLRENCLTTTYITVATDRAAGELPFEREGKIRRASQHRIMLRGQVHTVDY